MQRSVKLSLVEKLNSCYLEPNLWVFVINYAGIRANDIRLLRVDLKANSVASMQVVKNRLNKVAMKGTPFEDLAGGLSGQLAVVRTKDGISVARILRQYADSKKIDIVAYSDGCGVYGEDYLRELAQISSLDALRARLLSSLLVPVHSLLNVMHGVPSSLLGVMDQRSKQIQQ
jgi:large subunit ribosomal protein L10